MQLASLREQVWLPQSQQDEQFSAATVVHVGSIVEDAQLLYAAHSPVQSTMQADDVLTNERIQNRNSETIINPLQLPSNRKWFIKIRAKK